MLPTNWQEHLQLVKSLQLVLHDSTGEECRRLERGRHDYFESPSAKSLPDATTESQVKFHA